MYINVGVEKPHNASKKAFRLAVKEDPASVHVYGTSFMGPQYSGPVSEMPEGATLSVVGPDPERKRTWYASVKRTGAKVTVS